VSDTGKVVDKISDLTAPDPTDRPDYFDASPFVYKTGEARLMFAILIDAISLIWKGSGKLRSDKVASRAFQLSYREAVAWLNQTGHASERHLYSFENICRYLDLDPSWWRLQVTKDRPASDKKNIKRTSRVGRKQSLVPMYAEEGRRAG
jgi:hypothetical protein